MPVQFFYSEGTFDTTLSIIKKIERMLLLKSYQHNVHKTNSKLLRVILFHFPLIERSSSNSYLCLLYFKSMLVWYAVTKKLVRKNKPIMSNKSCLYDVKKVKFRWYMNLYVHTYKFLQIF